MADNTLDNIKAWIQQYFWTKRAYTATTRGTVDKGRPVVLDSSGHIDATLIDSADLANYALLPGRAGGQTLNGGTAASENLTLSSTAHATKGKVLADEPIRVRQAGSTRYRSEWLVTVAIANLNAYDDTGAAYIPLYLDGSEIRFRPGGPGGGVDSVFDANGLTVGGRLGGAWAGLTYTNGGGTTWTDYGGAYQVGQYKKFGDMVYIRGLCKRTAGAGVTIATLPAGFRPANRVLMIGMTDTGAGQIDIYTDGTINLISGGATFVSLNYPPFSIL